MMLLLMVGLACCTVGALGLIPPSNVCYQHTNIQNACVYGNLSVAVVGKMLRPKDCNSQINLRDIDHAPYLYINSTNSTERFTVIMLDAGPLGRGHDYLHWMVTNISINTPNYQSLSPINIIVDFEKPLMMIKSTTLIQFLVFRHDNVLRVPFGELWVTRKRDFSFSLLYSNTWANLRLCGPVAGAQFWVHDDSNLTPSAPMPQPGAPLAPVYVPMVPVGAAPLPAQPGYAPAPPPAVLSNPQHTHTNFQKKNIASNYQPLQLVIVSLAVIVIWFSV